MILFLQTAENTITYPEGSHPVSLEMRDQRRADFRRDVCPYSESEEIPNPKISDSSHGARHTVLRGAAVLFPGTAQVDRHC